MSPPENARSSRSRLHDGAKRRGAAGTAARHLPLFTADEAWIRTSNVHDLVEEKDDYRFILEPGFWMAMLCACLPIAAGCLYLLLTE